MANDLPPLTSNGMLPVESIGGYVYSQRPPTILTAGDAGPTIDGLTPLTAGTYLALTHTGAQSRSCTFETVAASANASASKYWWTPDDFRNGLGIHASLAGFTSGTVAIGFSVREPGIPAGTGDFSTYQTTTGTATALVSGVIRLFTSISAGFRGSEFAIWLKPTVNLVSPGSSYCRIAVWE